MKMRTGFVSNSSSSSFIVILPRMPTSSDDCWELMFNKEDGIIESYGHTKSMREVALLVYASIATKQNQSEDSFHQELMELLSYRYKLATKGSYITKGSPHYRGYYFYDHSDFYWGTDCDLLDEYIKITLQNYNVNEEITQEFNNLYRLERDGLDPIEKQRISERIAALEKKRRELWYNFDNGYELMLGSADVEALMADTKDQFICTFEYSDNTRDGSLMECGNIFRNLKHTKVSNH